MKKVKLLSFVFLFFVLVGSVFGQSSDLQKWFVAGDTGIVFFYPDDWTFIENSSTNFDLAEVEFDLTSGQRPRGVVFKILVRPKSLAYSGDGSLLGAFDVQATPPDGQTFAPDEMIATNIPMMRGDALLPANVAWTVIVADASDDSWIYMSIMNADTAVVESILNRVVAETDAGFPELDMSHMAVDDETESDGEEIADETFVDGYTVMLTAVGDKKINVIKAVRSLTGLGLADAKTLVESAPDAVVLEGIPLEDAESAKVTLETEGATVMIFGGEESVVAEDCMMPILDSTYRLMLVDVGDQSLSVMKELQDIAGLDLDGVKDLIATAPDAIVLENVDIATAQDAASTLNSVGATLEIWHGDELYEFCVSQSDDADSSGLYDVVIVEIGDQKINVIKAVRSLTSLGLADAKTLVESAPDAIVLTGVMLDVAETAQAELELVGATVALQSVP